MLEYQDFCTIATLEGFAIVHEVMAISAQPFEIFYYIILSIFVDVMDDENAKIVNAAIRASCRNIVSQHDVAIHGFPTAPVEMFFSKRPKRILPARKTGFVAEKLPIF